jgi:GAF domain-containing protein
MAMTLTEMIEAVDRLSADQLRQLREYIQLREQQEKLEAGTLNMSALLAGLEQLRAGLTEEQYREVERAMNEEYVEPVDKQA